jgi:hyperosmotically inducible periplasmic protein
MLKRMSIVNLALAVTLVTGGVAFAAQDVTDAATTAAVKSKFLGDTKVSGLNINVDTKDNVVTLTGTVHSAAEKAEALRLAKTTKGVKSVVNNLTVDPAKTPGNDTKTAAKDKADDAKDKTKSAAKKTGEATEHAAKKTGEATEHAAKKTGQATEHAAKKTGQATEHAAEKTGDAAKKVGKATENAAKDTGANITDASITTEVKTKFLADSKVGGMNINVDTNSHVVTLTGAVHSAAEKAEALRLARTTKGVNKVVDKLTIEPKKN